MTSQDQFACDAISSNGTRSLLSIGHDPVLYLNLSTFRVTETPLLFTAGFKLNFH